MVDRLPPAELVQPCPHEPAPPAVDASDTEIALWVHDVRSAGKACRAKHAALADWAIDKKPEGKP